MTSAARFAERRNAACSAADADSTAATSYWLAAMVLASSSPCSLPQVFSGSSSANCKAPTVSALRSHCSTAFAIPHSENSQVPAVAASCSSCSKVQMASAWNSQHLTAMPVAPSSHCCWMELTVLETMSNWDVHSRRSTLPTVDVALDDSRTPDSKDSLLLPEMPASPETLVLPGSLDSSIPDGCRVAADAERCARASSASTVALHSLPDESRKPDSVSQQA